MGAGALLGGMIGLLGVVTPGGSLNWFFHAPSAVIGLPLSLALIASGAVVRRMDQSAPRTLTPDEVTRLMLEADALSTVKLPTREPSRDAD